MREEVGEVDEREPVVTAAHYLDGRFGIGSERVDRRQHDHGGQHRGAGVAERDCESVELDILVLRRIHEEHMEHAPARAGRPSRLSESVQPHVWIGEIIYVDVEHIFEARARAGKHRHARDQYDEQYEHGRDHYLVGTLDTALNSAPYYQARYYGRRPEPENGSP